MSTRRAILELGVALGMALVLATAAQAGTPGRAVRALRAGENSEPARPGPPGCRSRFCRYYTSDPLRHDGRGRCTADVSC